MLRRFINSFQDHPSYFFIPALLFIFMPAFGAFYSAHTDGFLLLTKRWDLCGYPESKQLFMLGRPLGQLLINLQGWFTRSIVDLMIVRLLLLVAMIHLYQHLGQWLRQTFSLEKSWSFLISFLILLLPVNVFGLLSVSFGVPLFTSFYISFLSYKALNKNKRTLSGILFLSSTLIYPPISVAVFSFIFIKLLFTQDSWKTARLQIAKEIVFYSLLMLLYWLIVKLIIIPIGFHILKFPLSGNYAVEITKDLSTKITTFLAIIRHSILGSWDFYLFHNKTLEWTISKYIFAILTVIGFWSIQQKVFPIYVATQRLILGGLLFLLANAPLLLALNTSAPGYRVLLPSSIICLTLLIAALRICYFLCQQQKLRQVLNIILATCVIGIGVVTARIVIKAVANYHREFVFVDERARRINYQTTEQIIIGVNRPGETLIDEDMPAEFSLMTTVGEHVRYIFEHYNHTSKTKPAPLKEVQLAWPVYLDKYTELIDLTEIRGKNAIFFPPRKKVYLQAISFDHRNIFIDPLDMFTNPVILIFKERLGNDVLPYWEIGPTVNFGLLNITLMNDITKIDAYRLDATCIDSNGQPVDFAIKLQASKDSLLWEDLSIQSSATLQHGFATLTEHRTFKFFRFIFVKPATNTTLILKRIQIYDSNT